MLSCMTIRRDIRDIEWAQARDRLYESGFASFGPLPTSKGKRVRFSGATRTVIDGPFTETKELIAGYWLWHVRSMEEAVEWLKRAPFDGGAEVEIRQVFETEDFGANLTPEPGERERKLREQISSRK